MYTVPQAERLANGGALSRPSTAGSIRPQTAGSFVSGAQGKIKKSKNLREILNPTTQEGHEVGRPLPSLLKYLLSYC
jgi:hypothetical protein